MKKNKFLLFAAIIAIIGGVVIAADHIEAPAVASGTSDITDYYAFQGQDTDNVVFVANLQGLLSPAATASATFDENVLVEFNIDTDGDNVEDLVLQAIPRNGVMFFYGPVAPSSTGLNSTIATNSLAGQVAITPYQEDAILSSSNGMQFFAGPRDDPFFMDFSRFGEIVGGNAPGFNDPGTDTFAGTNVLSVVVEVPKSLVGSSGTINTWVETKRQQ